MPASKARSLCSLFRSAGKLISSSHADDLALKQYVSSIEISSSSVSSSFALTSCSIKSPKEPSHSSSKPLSELAAERLKLDTSVASHSEESTRQLQTEISAILLDGTYFDSPGSSDSELNGDDHMENYLAIPWFKNMTNNNVSLHRKEISRERKQKWVFKGSQSNRFERLVNMCAQKLGSHATIEVFEKLGRETGVKEYNALIGLCIDKARKTDDEEVSLQQICKAYKLFKSMREQGFPIEEQTYGPFLMFLIDMSMVEEFNFFCNIIRDKNSNRVSRLSYYEMLLWIGVNNEDKIKELCDSIATKDGGDKSSLQENYLLAFCESDREKELLLLLESIDITEVSSVEHVVKIFRSLGRHLLESYVKKFLQALKSHDIEAENISNFICNYAISIPNLTVGDVVLHFNNLHTEMEVAPSTIPYEKLIGHCCDSLKVHTALDIVVQIFEAGLTLSIETFNSILNACEESCDYNLVRHIYALMCRHNVKPNNETFRCMITLSVKMKDYHGAYGMISDMEKMDLIPTATMYNAIMAGYFREKNYDAVLRVLKGMEKAEVKPDSHTFSYLIGHCSSLEEITRCYEEMKKSRIQVTKQIYMALIHAYATCGQLEKAKQVVLDEGIPEKNLNELKSMLVSVLASHGEMPDALKIYKEMKQAKCNLEPRAIISLIEHLQNEGELDRLLQLLEELNDPEYWVDACFRVILYCVRYKHLSSTVDLLKQLKDKFCHDEVAREVLFDEIFCQIAEAEPVDMQFGLDLLQALKKELGICPSRRCLDFLLAACTKAKDLQSCFLIWREYEAAGLPYNVLNFLRMYQALLALGDGESARKMLRQIHTDDHHVCAVIKASQAAYGTREHVNKLVHKTREEEEEKKKKKKMKMKMKMKKKMKMKMKKKKKNVSKGKEY